MRSIINILLLTFILLILQLHTQSQLLSYPKILKQHKTFNKKNSIKIVNNVADSGDGSLRQTILDAVKGDTIIFDPTIFHPDSPSTIALTSGPLPEIIQGNLTIDASNAGVVVDGSALENSMGFTIASDSNSIRGLLIQHFSLDGIRIGEFNNPSFNCIGGNRKKGVGPNGEGNTIIGCGASGIAIYGSDVINNLIIGNYVGIDTTGKATIPNGRGINIRAPYNIVGSIIPGERNIVSGNRDAGILIETIFGYSNVIIGNYIGIDATGTDSVGNGTGIMISGAKYNTIGGDIPEYRNIISGNRVRGIEIRDIHSDSNAVTGNYIGTDATGTIALPNNGAGVVISEGAKHNIIGGNKPEYRNIISGNASQGIWMGSVGTDSNKVLGNYIGTDHSGTLALGNRHQGVCIWQGPKSNIIGGQTENERNVIVANAEDGIFIYESNNNNIVGNYIGIDASGTVAIGNGQNGISMNDRCQNNVIGGTTEGERNIISGNNENGVSISGNGTVNNKIKGNYIGTDVNGTNVIPNDVNGVTISSGAKANVLGGETSWERNIISGNKFSQVEIEGAGCDSNIVIGNYIGTDVSGSKALGGGYGVRIEGGAQYNVLGGKASDKGNLISGNDNCGVVINDEGTMNNSVMGNLIGTDVNGTTALGNGGGVSFNLGSQHNIIGGKSPEERNVISGNSADGVTISARGTSYNVICGNYIGPDISGTKSMQNNQSGVSILNGATNNIIGTTTIGGCNIISGNNEHGISISGNSTVNNKISGNFIGTDASGTASLGNGTYGVIISDGAMFNIIGGTSEKERNIISGQINGDGVWIGNESTSNVVIGNYIGTDSNGTNALSNGGNGVSICLGAQYNTVGGSTSGEHNIISGNLHEGIRIAGASTNTNHVVGNYIGIDITGAKAISNLRNGILIDGGAQHNFIGGEMEKDRNIISGNRRWGIEINGVDTNHNHVVGNFIGTDATGTIAVGNGEIGVAMLWGASENNIKNCVISGNGNDGVSIHGVGAVSNHVTGNFIGTNFNGTVDIPNDNGIAIFSGAKYNTIGGTTEEERNIISGNDNNGIYISDEGTDSNTVIGNYIGTDVGGTMTIGNTYAGIAIGNGAKRNVIGVGGLAGNGSWAGNLISGNNGSGIYADSGTTENIVSGNLILANTNRGIDFTSSTAIVTNNTIVDNNDGGLALYSNSSVEIKNNIIAQNQDEGILAEEGSTLTISYNDVWKNRTNYSGCSAGIGNISTNPLFTDPSNNDYHLQMGSPCIDAGDPDTMYNDIDGTRNDMGAYGGPNGESYIYIDGPPFIDINETFSSGFVEPGDPIIISSKVYDLVGSVVSVVAEIENPDETLIDSLILFDDGSHNDIASGDSIWANNWVTEQEPGTYFVNIIATDNNSNSTKVENVIRFTTDGSILPLHLTTDQSNDENPTILESNDGSIWLFWNSNREGHAQIWYKKSTDDGVTWSSDIRLFSRQDCNSPSVTQSSDGKIWLFWYESRGEEIWFVTSSDNGVSWSTAQQFTNSLSIDERPDVVADENGKVVVVWNSWRTGNHDIFCRLSHDNGDSWTDPIQITTDFILDEDPSVAIDSNGHIHVVWFWQHDFINYSMSSDNGKTWTEPIIISSGIGGIFRHPAINIDSSGKIWVAFNHWVSRNNNAASHLFYTTSINGTEWSVPIQITQFVGYDGFSDLITINNEQRLVWHSNRAVNSDIWSGKIDFTNDLNPPPTVYSLKHQPFSPAPTAENNITIRAEVSDESAISSVYLIYSINDQIQSNLLMFDDGSHNDDDAGDDIWAIEIGKYPEGAIIKYQVEVEDIAGNIITAPQDPGKAEVIGLFIQTSNILLVADVKKNYSDWLLPFYTEALDANGYNYDIWDCYLRGVLTNATLNTYLDGAVLWFTPFESGWVNDSLVQATLQNYMENGGKLFISGQDIASTLKGTKFLNDYLHAKYIQEIDNFALQGVLNDPITDGLTVLIIEGDGANNQWSPDEIDPVSPAVSIFNYGLSPEQSLLAANSLPGDSKKSNSTLRDYKSNFSEMERADLVRSFNQGSSSKVTTSSSGSGAVRVDNGTYKLVYFAFGFEGINSVNDRSFLMYSIIKWLLPSAHEAGILYITPDKGNNIGSVTVTIHGFGFQQGATVKLAKSGYQDIIGTETTVVDSGKIITSFDLIGAALGRWDIVVTNLYDQELILSNGFVVGVGYINPWINCVGRDQIRLGRSGQYYLSYGNSGNVDLSDVLVLVSLPADVACDLNIPPAVPDIDTLVLKTGKNSEIFAAILIHRFTADSSDAIPFSLTSETTNQIFIRNQIFLESPYLPVAPLGSNLKVHSNNYDFDPKELSATNDYPPPGWLVYRDSPNGDGFGHVGVSLGDGRMADAQKWTNGRIITFDDWKAEEGQYLGSYPPPNWSDDAGKRIADLAEYKINQPGGIPYELWPYNKGELGKWNCVRFAEYVCEMHGCDPIPKDSRILTPGTQYNKLSGKRWPGSSKFYIKVWQDEQPEWPEIAETKDVSVVNSWDPNEKAGPSGFGEIGAVAIVRDFQYIIYFENVDSATAAAQEVTVIDTLDDKLDWTSFQFNNIQFGENMISISDSNESFSTNFHLNDTADVKIKTTFDPQTGIVRWYLRGTDIRNGDYADFLPPNKISPEGEGHVSFTIKPKQDLTSGTKICNHASIIFDVNPPINTNEVLNTIDASSPNSNVTEAFTDSTSLEYNIKWTGADESLGSGLKNFSLFVSDNGGPYISWITNSTDTVATFTAEDGHVYRFYSIARDSVGNIESQPDSFDIKIKALKPEPLPPTRFYLSQNYPNPFNFATTILYELPNTSLVKLEVYNILGQKVKTLINEKKEAGYYKLLWDGCNDLDQQVSSGIYLFKLITNDFKAVKKGLVIK